MKGKAKQHDFENSRKRPREERWKGLSHLDLGVRKAITAKKRLFVEENIKEPSSSPNREQNPPPTSEGGRRPEGEFNSTLRLGRNFNYEKNCNIEGRVCYSGLFQGGEKIMMAGPKATWEKKERINTLKPRGFNLRKVHVNWGKAARLCKPGSGSRYQKKKRDKSARCARV